MGAEFELRGDVVEGALEAALNEAAEMRDQVLRTQAEFDNFRKRISREREDERKRATERLVTSCCLQSTTSSERSSTPRPTTTSSTSSPG